MSALYRFCRNALFVHQMLPQVQHLRKHPAKAAMGWLSSGSGSGFAVQATAACCRQERWW